MLTLILLLLTACSQTVEPADQAPNAQKGTLEALWADRASEARDLAGGSCWLVSGGDGALWSGKYAALTDCDDFGAAEREPGLWERSPGHDPKNPSSAYSSWSRDMGTGLITYAWRRDERAMLERHAAYGSRNNWQMGVPFGDGRSVYTPNILGLLFEAIYRLGGADTGYRLLPPVYGSGLRDFQAHLVVMSIMLRGEMVGGISDAAARILAEQAARDPRDPLFQAVHGIYAGDLSSAVTACLADDYAGEYVRCDGDQRRCYLAGWLFACKLVIDHLP